MTNSLSGKEFRYGNDKVFLSGTNAAWINYGYDFGNGQWDSTTKPLWEDELKKIGDVRTILLFFGPWFNALHVV